MIGLRGSTSTNMGDITDTTFYGNSVTSSADQSAGILYIPRKSDGTLAITNSIFQNNTFTSMSDARAIYVGSNATTATAANTAITVSADSGQTTRFYNTNGNGGEVSSIVLGDVFNTTAINDNASITVTGDGTVELLDPVKMVIDDNANSNSLTFTKEGSGTLISGGNNVITTGTGTATWSVNEGTQILSNVKGSDATITVNRGNAGTYSLASGATLSGSGTITAEDVNIAGTVELVKYTTDSPSTGFTQKSRIVAGLYDYTLRQGTASN